MAVLGKLTRIENLRHYWPNEAHDFTHWLAAPDNLALLSDFLGFGPDGLELESVEHFVGPFRADLLCRNTRNGTWVLIENQLEQTDHGHLGQILTYAAGLDAKTIVWIAKRVTDQHRAAFEWLNAMSLDEISFFAAEIELWQVDDSIPAPRLNGIVRPNAEQREASTAKQSLVSGTVSPTQVKHRLYWTKVRDLIAGRTGPLRPFTPPRQNWIAFGIGKTGILLQMATQSKEKRIRVEIYFTGSSAHYYFLQIHEQKTEIEAALGEALDWQRMPKEARVCVTFENADPFDEADWDRQHAWLVSTAERFHAVFAQRIRSLKPPSVEDAVE